MLMEIAQSAHHQENIGEERWFLADHTNGRAYATVLRPGARELSESCVSQNSGSLETEQPCVLAQGGGSGVSPPTNFCNLWANLHSEPFAGQNDLQN